MFIATIIVSVLLALALLASARLWLSRDPQVLAIVERTQLPASSPPYLASLKIAGAVGVLVGLAVSWLGVAAAAGVVAYFIVAVIAHVRVGDYKQVYAPAIPLVLAIAAMVLRLVTL
jgi:hypothetical protein